MNLTALKRALGSTVRLHRRRKGFSQEGFADHVGLHRTYIGAIERGERNVSLANLHLIAQALDLSLSELIRQAEDSNQSKEQV